MPLNLFKIFLRNSGWLRHAELGTKKTGLSRTKGRHNTEKLLLLPLILFVQLSFQRCQIWQFHANWPSDWQHSTQLPFQMPLDFCHNVFFGVQGSERQAPDRCISEVKSGHGTSANEGKESVPKAVDSGQIWESLYFSDVPAEFNPGACSDDTDNTLLCPSVHFAWLPHAYLLKSQACRPNLTLTSRDAREIPTFLWIS